MISQEGRDEIRDNLMSRERILSPYSKMLLLHLQIPAKIPR
jgi:hypothetical protein